MLTQFTVGCSRTINLGNYESLRVEASVVIAVSEEADLVELKAQAQKELRELLETTYLAQHKRNATRNGERHGEGGR